MKTRVVNEPDIFEGINVNVYINCLVLTDRFPLNQTQTAYTAQQPMNPPKSAIVKTQLAKWIALMLLFLASASMLRAQPALVDALSLGNPAGDIVVIYSVPVNANTATNILNYSLNNGATITGARMDEDAQTVILGTANMAGVPGNYTVTVNNVQDSNGNAIAPNSAIQLEQSLDTWLPMDETVGTNAISLGDTNDTSGIFSNFTGTGNVIPDFIGKVDNSYYFTGNGGYVTLTNASAYADFSGGLTIAMWVNIVPSVNDSWARFVEMGNGPSSDNIIFARNGASSQVDFSIYVGGNGQSPLNTPDGLLTSNQWEHVAVTLDNSGGTFGNAIIYVNGTNVAETQLALPNVLPRVNSYVGRSNFSQDGYFAGRMDDVRIYNRALSQEAISALVAGGGPDDMPADPIIGVVASTNNTSLHNTPPGAFTFIRTGNTNVSVTAQYSISGTATNGVNYSTIPTTVTFPADVASETVLIKPVDFSFSVPSETVTLTLTNSPNYTVNFTNGDSDSDTVTIYNNDSANPPEPVAVTVDNAANYTNDVPTVIDVWFNEQIYANSALNIGNYSLSAGGVTITNAVTLGSYGVGVALGVSGNLPTNAVLTVTGVTEGPGGPSGTYSIPVYSWLSPANIVAPSYHVPGQSRSASFSMANDGITSLTEDNGLLGGDDWWDGVSNLTQVGWSDYSQFLGMIYGSAVDVQAIKIDLCQQFVDGGSWAQQPYVYILKNPVDTDLIHPENDTNDWVKVPATLVSGSQFSPSVSAQTTAANTPIVFSLAGVPDNVRTGYGWAVGGVDGAGVNQFLSYSEIRGYGYTETNAALTAPPTTNLTVLEGESTVLLADTETTMPLSYQWELNGVAIANADNANYNLISPALGGGGQYSVIMDYGSFSVTDVVANVTIAAQTNIPRVIDAVIALNRTNIDLWFSQPVAPGSTTNLATYALNDPNITVTNAIEDVKGHLVTLEYTGSQSVPTLTVTLTNLYDPYGNTNASQTVAMQEAAWPVLNVVADAYQQGRGTSLTLSTNGIISQSNGGQWWQTFSPGPEWWNSFVGLTYQSPQTFDVLRVDLGNIFVDGGDWAEQPKVYILVNNFDTDQLAPEEDPRDWVEVPGAKLISGSVFQTAPDGPPFTPSANTNGPIAFDLSGVPASQRTGYGWAIGGVPGQGANEFLSISELGASVSPPPPTLTISVSGTDVVVSWSAAVSGYVLQTSASLEPSPNWTTVGATVQVVNGLNTVTIPRSGATAFYRLESN